MGSPGVPGTLIVMTAAHVGMGVNQSMFMVGVKNRPGAAQRREGRPVLGTFTVVGVLHQITVDFFAWTPGTLQFTGLTSKGTALPNVTAAGSFNLNAQGGGAVTLVSPSKVSIDGGVSERRTMSFTSLAFGFVPEPSALLLLGGIRERERLPRNHASSSACPPEFASSRASAHHGSGLETHESSVSG